MAPGGAPGPCRGNVVAYDRVKGYGFIRPERAARSSENPDVFFHIKEATGADIVRGDRVSYYLKTEGDGGRKRREATRVEGGTRPGAGGIREKGIIESVCQAKNFALVRGTENQNGNLIFLHSTELGGRLLEDWKRSSASVIGKETSFTVHRRGDGLPAALQASYTPRDRQSHAKSGIEEVVPELGRLGEENGGPEGEAQRLRREIHLLEEKLKAQAEEIIAQNQEISRVKQNQDSMVTIIMKILPEVKSAAKLATREELEKNSTITVTPPKTKLNFAAEANTASCGIVEGEKVKSSTSTARPDESPPENIDNSSAESPPENIYPKDPDTSQPQNSDTEEPEDNDQIPSTMQAERCAAQLVAVYPRELLRTDIPTAARKKRRKMGRGKGHGEKHGFELGGYED